MFLLDIKIAEFNKPVLYAADIKGLKRDEEYMFMDEYSPPRFAKRKI